jgi:hypothetical protein
VVIPSDLFLSPDLSEEDAREYLRSLAGYEKNTHADLPADTRAEIARTWRRTFEEWKYPL